MSTSTTCCAAGLAAALVLASCGGSSDSTSSSPPVTADDPAVASTEPSATEVPDTTAAPPSTAEPTTTSTGPSTPPTELADLDAIATITVTTPTSGNGERPLLSWDPVESAAGYALTLIRSDGQAYWAWTGTEPQVWLGGSATPPPTDASGPVLAEPMTMRVVAVDADGAIFAASQPTEITP